MNVIKSLIGAVIGAIVATGIYYVIKQSTGETYVWFPLVTGVLTGLVARSLADSSPSNAASYVCGALAGLIAGAAIFSVEFVPALLAKGPDRGPVVVRWVDSKPKSTDDSDSTSEPPADAEDSDEPHSDDAEPEKSSDPVNRNKNADENLEQATDDVEPTTSETTHRDREYVDLNQATRDRDQNRRDQSMPVHQSGEGTTPSKERSAFRIWLDEYLPFIYSGIGILLAYQLARGFEPAAPKSAVSAS